MIDRSLNIQPAETINVPESRAPETLYKYFAPGRIARVGEFGGPL